jgi:hypothetical protein
MTEAHGKGGSDFHTVKKNCPKDRGAELSESSRRVNVAFIELSSADNLKNY